MVNTFTRDLVGTLTNATGAPMIIRIGGTSQDSAIFNASQKVPVKKIGPDNGLRTNLSIGPSWFEGYSNVANSKYAWQVPIKRPVNDVESSTKFAEVAIKAIKNLESLELGNEPNLYDNPQQYVDQFLPIATTIKQNSSLPAGPQFQAGAVSTNPHGWTALEVFNDGVNSRNQVKSFSMHYYQSVDDHVLRSALLDHRFTVSQTDKLFKKNIQDVHARGIPFVLGEVGSSLNANEAKPSPEALDGVLGSALWVVDWLLYAMAANVDRVNMQQGIDFGFAAWRPVRTAQGPPIVFPQWYGYAFVADLIGKKARRVLPLFDPAHPSISPYATYVNDVLDSYAVVDLQEWNATETAQRPVRQIRLDVADSKGAQLRRLTGTGTQAKAADMTWAGLKYSFEHPKGQSVGPGVERLSVANGATYFPLKASEAVLGTLQR